MPFALSINGKTGIVLRVRETSVVISAARSALGKTMPATPRNLPSAASCSNQGVPTAFTRISTGRSHESHPATACLARSLSPGATASSRSTMTASAPLPKAFSKRSGRVPGTNRNERRWRSTGCDISNPGKWVHHATVSSVAARIHRQLHVRYVDTRVVRLHSDLHGVVDHAFDRDQHFHGRLHFDRRITSPSLVLSLYLKACPAPAQISDCSARHRFRRWQAPSLPIFCHAPTIDVAAAKPSASVVRQRIDIMNIAHIRSRFFVAVLFLTMLAFGNTVSAQTVDSSDPQILIKSVTQQVLDEVHKQAIDPSDIPRIMDIVNRDILPYIDFEHTTQLALARYWRTATPAQQQQLTQQFKMLLIHLYSGALAQLKPDQKIDYPPMRVAPTDSD